MKNMQKIKLPITDNIATEQVNEFRKFITSPSIIQLSIGVIVGGSLTDLIKSVISFASNLFYYLSLLLFSKNHSAKINLVLDPLRSVFENFLTLCTIAACVFFFVKLVNKFLIKEASETLGYNAQLEETKKLIKIQHETNELLKKSVNLQEKLLNQTEEKKN
ncbi:MscL family protein [Leuconostoc mesenteroides]|uniref:MscL family protein n=2 Tax=Leuconostoc mesenteroides TaxID=1245 RepID=UPI001CC0BA4C|nr:MscL family protein [Leuconostoc mesenteroides]